MRVVSVLAIAGPWLFFTGVGGQQPEKLVIRADAAAARPLRPGIFSIAATYTLDGLRPDDPQITRIMRTIKPPFLRVPGGDTMNYWDWNAGAVRTADQLKAFGADPDAPKAVGVLKAREAYLEKMGGPMIAERWAGVAKAGGAEPIWGLNITTMAPEDTRKFMLHLKAAHLPATHFELGNELSFGRLWARMIPNVQAYIQKAKAHASEIKAVFPEAKVAVCITIPVISAGLNAKDPPPVGSWSAALAKESFYDAVILHSYTFTSELGNLKDHTADDYSRYALIRSSAPMLEGILGFAGRIFPDKEIWLTEWNLNNRLYERAHPEQSYRPEHTLLSGLFVANFLLNSATVPSNLTIANLWNIYGDPYFGLISGQPPKERPSFQVLRMLSPAIHECDRIEAIAVPQSPRWRGPGKFSVLEAPAVAVFAFFKGREMKYLAFVNFTEQGFTIDVNAKGAAKAEWMTGAELLPGWDNPKNPPAAKWFPAYEMQQADVRLEALRIVPRSFTVVKR